MLLFVFYTLKPRCDLTLVCGFFFSLSVKYYCSAVEQKHIYSIYDEDFRGSFHFSQKHHKCHCGVNLNVYYAALIPNSIPIGVDPWP